MAAMTDETLEGIAIIGMAGRFPGAGNVAEFWRKLAGGEETISTVSAPEPNGTGTYVPRRGLLDKPEWFDAAFFGIPPREAEVLDPQQRVFLEECWTALEDAGCDPNRYRGAIGVFAGMSNNTYFAQNVAHHPELTASVGWLTAMMANEKDYLATRVAYKLNLRGPAVNTYTACSTSLVAVCQAVQALLSYGCDVALAGGVSITFPHERGYFFDDGGILSVDGHCRAFDIHANGTVFSNGVGVVALKRLADAVADGDQIHAVIKGAALNNDGSSKVSFTAPSVEGHAEVIALAHALANVDPRSITYVEAHGTGTPLGDPIEVAGLTQAFREGTPDRNFCALGSVKTNIGHLDAAAGIAGLIKTTLALKHRRIPANLHFTEPNPALRLEESPFFVAAESREWTSSEGPRRAGVSSFGVGGTNAHVVLEEAPSLAPRQDEGQERPHLLVLSAKTESALARRDSR
jgi:acyl transferase domain-containing protein